MNPAIRIFLLSITAFVCARADESKQPLLVQAPKSWEVVYKGDNGMQFYTATQKEGGPALLMFSRWPIPGSKDQIPSALDGMAKEFIKQIKEQKVELESTEHKTEKIEGDSYSGQFVVFTIKADLVQTLFMLSNGDEIWNGQFTGSKKSWLESIDILKKLKKS